MTDAKTAPKAQPQAETKATDQTGSTDGASYLAIGRLRRDLLIVGQGDAEQVKTIAKAAVLEGRAAEVFVTQISGYFSESEVRWDADKIDVAEAGAASPSETPALLNVHESAAKSVAKAAEGESKLEPTTVQAERRKAAEATKTKADLVDGEEALRKAKAEDGETADGKAKD